MVNLVTNLDALIAELEGQKKVIEDRLMPYVMQPEKHLQTLKDGARTVLEGLCQPEEREMIDALVATVIGFATGKGGMAFEMAASSGLMGAANAGGGVGGEGTISYGLLEEFEDDIADWVAQYKEKDASDTYKGGRGHYPGEPMSDVTIARRIMAIISQNPESFFSSGRAGHGMDDPQGLWQYLCKNPEWLKRFGLTGMGGGRALELMDAVLAFWEEIMGVRIVNEGMSALDKVLNPTKT